jgi:hypothetical protein
MEWDITREDGGEAHPDGLDAPGWDSRLRLRFALLGEVEARLSLRGGRLHLDIEGSGDAPALLRASAPRLQDAMAAAGSELAALRIRSREGE